jgi:hypothetical protein
MTACAIEPEAAPEDGAPRPGCTITADGAYAARLTLHGDGRFPERWTLDGPEPYAVPLPLDRPEAPGTEVHPMGDGRVLVRRPAAGRHEFCLLYPTGPGTGEAPVGAIECPDEDTRLRLLPPVPGGARAYALAVGRRSSTVWLVVGGARGPERVAEVPGRCSGGVWLDRTGRMLALDRETGGRTKAVVVDLERAGEVSPLLQIADGSDDRLLLADPDSGLLLIGSDAPSPGEERLGWGVLGSTLPVRFPECLRVPDCVVTPFAVQPGQVLTPEQCRVALRVDGPVGSWVGLWRPDRRQVDHLPAPEGWLTGAGCWSREGVLHLPCATAEAPCGVVRVTAPDDRPSPRPAGAGAAGAEGTGPVTAGVAGPAATEAAGPATAGAAGGAERAAGSQSAVPDTEPENESKTEPETGPENESETGPGTASGTEPRTAEQATGHAAERAPAQPSAPRPVPLQQAPLGRLVTK